MDIKHNKIHDFTDLITWKKAHEIVLDTYNLIKKFPDDEKYGLTSQMRRAAVSITSNIAEGFGRSTGKDKGHFYTISKGSLFELRSQYYIAKDLCYIKEQEISNIKEKIIEVEKLISGLINNAPDKH